MFHIYNMLQKDLFQKIDNRESDSCRSDIAPREGADLLAAVGTSVLIVFHIGVSASYHRFQAPAVADRPVISVGEASPRRGRLAIHSLSDWI